MKSLLAVILATTPAFADYHPYAVSPGPAPEPKPVIDRGYLGGGAGLALDHFFNSYLDIEGAVRLADLPLWIRGSGAAGNAFDFQGSGSFRRLRVGLPEAGVVRAKTGTLNDVTTVVGYLGRSKGTLLVSLMYNGKKTTAARKQQWELFRRLGADGVAIPAIADSLVDGELQLGGESRE
jgi:hypothetical protein